MIEHLSLRSPKEQADADISADLKMARKGVMKRITFAAVVGACSLLWLPPLASAAYLAAIAAWELAGRPWLAKHAVAALHGQTLWVVQRLIILFVACIYAVVPLTGILGGAMIGWYVAILMFCTAVISGITYFSNDKWQLAAFIAPSFLIACAAPFVFGTPLATTMAVLVLNALFTLSALQSAVHRAQLVESVTRQNAARSRAETANVEKSQFIANVSHELRSPLNAIIGYSEMLREAAEEDSRKSDEADLDKVLTASRRLLHLVNELLDISKIEAGKLSLNVSWFDAEEMIEAAVEAARPFAEANSGAVSFTCADNLGQGVSDEFRLSQCVLNLLTNALAQPGEVTLQARRVSERGGEWFLVEVSDTRTGVDEAALERMFDPFAQTEISTNAGGASLGLAITRRIARLLGGDVTAACGADGGVTFTLRAPVIARVNGAEPTEAQRATRAA